MAIILVWYYCIDYQSIHYGLFSKVFARRGRRDGGFGFATICNKVEGFIALTMVKPNVVEKTGYKLHFLPYLQYF